MKVIFRIAWERFKIIAAIIGDAQAQAIATVFYFTILAPFGLLSRLSGDPLQQRSKPASWLERASVPDDLETAKRQG